MAVSDSAGLRIKSPVSHPWLARALSVLDVRLRRGQAVFEFTRNPACVFRLDIGHQSRSVVLADGMRVSPERRIARLHFWNEQIPRVPDEGPNIGWARRMQRGMAISLQELAHFLASRPDLADIEVISADAPSGTRAQSEQLARIMGRFGFESIAAPEPLTFGERLHRFGENILISMIVLTHNASALRPDTLSRVRLPIYLSRRVLEREFGGTG